MGTAGVDQTEPLNPRRRFPEGLETNPRIRLVSGSDGADAVISIGREIVKSDPDRGYRSVGSVVRNSLRCSAPTVSSCGLG
jgi:hypothetical protein